MNVYESLSESGTRFSDRIAIIDSAGTLSYAELWREIETLRLELSRLGVAAGQGLGIRARNSRGFIIGAMAALGCGAVVMPIHHQLKPQELADMLERAPLQGLLDDGTGTPPSRETLTFKVSGGGTLRFSRFAGETRPLAPGIKHAAFVRFTSGTTGAAKGVALTHRAVLERIRAANRGLKLGPDDTVLWVLPMAYHFYVSILLYLDAGSAIIVSNDYLAESLLKTAEAHKATFLYLTPMHVRLLVSEPSGLGMPASVRTVMSVSSRLDPQMARDFQTRYRLPVAQGYGIIEIGLPIMNVDDAGSHPESIGRPLPDFSAVILNEHGVRVTNGETGQLALRGPGMFEGYLSPRRQRDEVIADGYFLTGDLAHFDPAGRIVLDGRTSSVIHVAGHKVFPEEVAGVLDLHPAVLRSRITTRPHPQFGEVVHADVQPRNSGDVTPEALQTFCRQRLSSHKVPASISFVTELQLTPSGKVRHG